MDASPKVLYWGFTGEEMDKFNQLLEGLSAPPAVV